MGKNFLRIAYFNKNFSVSADLINLRDSPDLGKNRVRIMDSKHNSSRQSNHSLLL